jgi:hypothetical protein
VEIVPVLALPPATPFTCQVTAVLLVFFTVAAKVCVLAATTLAVAGETETVTEAGGGVALAPVIFTVAEAETLVLA